MADISGVNVAVIKDLYQRLESLGCRRLPFPLSLSKLTLLTISSSNHDAGIVLRLRSTIERDSSPSQCQRSRNHTSFVTSILLGRIIEEMLQGILIAADNRSILGEGSTKHINSREKPVVCFSSTFVIEMEYALALRL